jgi:hypothetical protein
VFEFERLIEQQIQQLNHKYNFDFQTGTPMQGDLEWLPVEKQN